MKERNWVLNMAMYLWRRHLTKKEIQYKGESAMMRKICLVVFTSILVMMWTRASAQTVLVLSSDNVHYMALAQGFSSNFSGSFKVINLEGSEEKLRKTGESLSANPPPLLIVAGNEAAQMAEWYMKDTPVIYCSASRASAFGLKGSKIVGIYHEPSLQDQLSAMVKAFPDKKKVGIIYNKKVLQDQVNKLAEHPSLKSIELVQIGLSNIKEVPVKTRETVAQVNLVWAVQDPEFINPHTFPYIILQSIQHSVPVFCGNQEMVKSGATAALTEDSGQTGALLSRLATQVVGGQNPSPRIQFPPGKLILNTKTAAVIGIKFPPEVMKKAGLVIR
jgi:ABC-type uncharacterized transport system substrate-binding protein